MESFLGTGLFICSRIIHMAVSDFSHKQEAEDLKKTHEKENKKTLYSIGSNYEKSRSGKIQSEV